MNKKVSLEKLPQMDLESMAGWGRLAVHDQSVVRNETKLLMETILDAGKARLSIGEHLTKVRDVLEPLRIFDKYLKTLNFHRSTAYRYIDNYLAARTILPAPVMQVALMRGTERINARLVAANPPPRNGDMKEITAYLQKVEKKSKAAKHGKEIDEDLLAKEAWRFVSLRFQKLPSDKRTRTRWAKELSGMVLAMAGIQSAVSIEPVAVPDDYRAVVGRPRKQA